jgi:NTE family protein
MLLLRIIALCALLGVGADAAVAQSASSPGPRSGRDRGAGTVTVAPPLPAEAGRRPKIGLVLSGGGARGFTHIGVLKVLDELRIPVDYIAATSMGSIVGGLYAIGTTPQQMEQIVADIDWSTMFSDSPPRRDISFRDRQLDVLYPLPLEIGFRDGEFLAFKGALTGGNLELFLHKLTARADGVQDFDRLPIPFRAVATDMVDGQPYVFDDGPLYEAMRASMSIPGIFSPADVRGRILGDGSLVDNLPIDVVRKMGAEVVIAVNIGTPLMRRDQLSSVIGVTSQMLNILTEQNVRIQLATLGPRDILISPDLGGLSVADFNQVGKFIDKGVDAGQQVRERLLALALDPAQYAEYKAAQPKIVDTPPPVIEFVRVEGTVYANPAVLAAELAIPVGVPLDTKALDAGIARLNGSGEYDRVEYRFVEEGGQRGLAINVHEKTIGPNYLRFGLSFSTDFQGESTFALLMGHRRVWLNSLGGEWRNEFALGRIARAATELYQPLDLRQSLFASAYASAQSAPRYVFDGSTRIAEYSIQTNTVGFDLGFTLASTAEIRIGPTYTFYKGTPTISVPLFETVRQTDRGGRLLARVDNLDDPFFPTQGARATLDLFYGDRTQQIGSGPELTTKQLGRGEFAGNVAFPLTDKSFLNVAARAGALNKDDPSLVDPFLLGGLLNLSGLRTGQLAGTYMAFGRVVYYHRMATVPLIGGSVYLGGSIEAGNTWDQRSAVSAGDLVKAGSVFLAANTFIGPFYFAYGRASGGASSFYLFLGRPQ